MRTRFIMPEGMRYSNLSERKEFYKNGFDLKGLEKWMDGRKIENTVFAGIIGRHTGIYRKKYKKIASGTVLFADMVRYDELRRSLLDYLPEGAYYDRGLYSDRSKCGSCREIWRCFRCKNFLGQELAFDLDPENVVCPIHGDLAEKMVRHQGLGFCTYEFGVVKEKTVELYEYLEKRFSDMRIVYSGRGFHIHVMDEKTHLMRYQARKKLAKEVKEKGFPIDEWVTSGEMRLIRLPYSLHGMVSRLCLPLALKEIKGFDPVKNKKVLPDLISSSR